MKEIFQRRLFWVILDILLIAVFVYPPFVRTGASFLLDHRYWDWIFNWNDELDLKMILAESILAILLAIGICLIPFHKGNKK